MSCRFRVAMVLPKGHEYASRLIEGIVGFAEDQPGFEFVEVPYNEGMTPPAVYQIEVDGALVWTNHDSPWVMDLRDRGVKIVSLNSEWRDEGIACVGLDQDAMLDSAVEHLAGVGRAAAAYVGHNTASGPAKLRMQDGFLSRAQRRGWTAAALEIPGIPSEQRQRLAKPELEAELISFLRSVPTPVSIFCDDDYVGVLVCRVAAHLGLTVPGDVAVLGFFDMAVGRFSSPTLSSVPSAGQLVGAAGMKLLNSLLTGKPVANRHVFVAPPPVIRRESTGGVVVRDEDIRRAYQLIQQHACEGLNVEHLLDRLAISQKTLNKRFAAVYGHTPGQEIRRVRVERAKRWLSTTNLGIARIALMCGFDEPSNFNLFFKREAGCTPSEFRSQSG